MGRFKRRIFLILGLLTLPAAATAGPADKALFLTETRAAYYNLPRAGFAGARCRIVPDYPFLIGKPRSDPEMQEGFAILETLQFSLVLDASGVPTIGKNDPGGPRTGKAAEGIQQIFSGMDQTLTGFFQTWSVFMIAPPLPQPDQEVAIADQSGGYRLRYKDGATEVITDTNRAGEISQLDVRSAEFVSVLRPRFDHDPSGLVLSSYVADYVATSGADKTHLVIGLEYQTVNGVKIPGRLTLEGVYDDTPFRARLAFADCQVDRKAPR